MSYPSRTMGRNLPGATDELEGFVPGLTGRSVHGLTR
jgi:hypothetical protein